MAKKTPPLALVDNGSKPVEKPVEFMPGRNGGRLKRGGTIGPGRPREAWKLECEGLASRDDMLTKARKVLGNTDHPAWLGAWKFVAEQAYGKPDQAVAVAGGQTIEIIVRNESQRERVG